MRVATIVRCKGAESFSNRQGGSGKTVAPFEIRHQSGYAAGQSESEHIGKLKTFRQLDKN